MVVSQKIEGRKQIWCDNFCVVLDGSLVEKEEKDHATEIQEYGWYSEMKGVVI
jgi:hypothetical protein